MEWQNETSTYWCRRSRRTCRWALRRPTGVDPWWGKYSARRAWKSGPGDTAGNCIPGRLCSPCTGKSDTRTRSPPGKPAGMQPHCSPIIFQLCHSFFKLVFHHFQGCSSETHQKLFVDVKIDIDVLSYPVFGHTDLWDAVLALTSTSFIACVTSEKGAFYIHREGRRGRKPFEIKYFWGRGSQSSRRPERQPARRTRRRSVGRARSSGTWSWYSCTQPTGMWIASVRGRET